MFQSICRKSKTVLPYSLYAFVILWNFQNRDDYTVFADWSSVGVWFWPHHHWPQHGCGGSEAGARGRDPGLEWDEGPLLGQGLDRVHGGRLQSSARERSVQGWSPQAFCRRWRGGRMDYCWMLICTSRRTSCPWWRVWSWPRTWSLCCGGRWSSWPPPSSSSRTPTRSLSATSWRRGGWPTSWTRSSPTPPHGARTGGSPSAPTITRSPAHCRQKIYAKVGVQTWTQWHLTEKVI